MAQNNLFWQESSGVLTSAQTLTGATRYCGVASGSAAAYASFNAYAFADVAGTMRIEVSYDQSTWRRATADQAVSAGAALILSIPVFAPYYRVVFINGATGQGAFLCGTSFTAA